MLASSHAPAARTDRLSLARYVHDRYWPVLRPGLAMSSLSREWPILDQFADRLGLLRLDQLRAEHLEGWWAHLRGRVQPATCNRHLVRVGHCLRTGVRWGLLAQDPSSGIRKLKPPKGRVRWLSDDQRSQLIEQAEPGLRLYILAGRYTAGRRANLHELRRRDLDLASMTVTFQRTKNGDSQTVPLHPVLLASLSPLPVDPAAYLLPRLHPVSISRAFKKLTTRLGVVDFRFHDLRHDVATSLASAGASTPVIMAALGHRDPRMSARYAHVTPETLRRAMGQL